MTGKPRRSPAPAECAEHTHVTKRTFFLFLVAETKALPLDKPKKLRYMPVSDQKESETEQKPGKVWRLGGEVGRGMLAQVRGCTPGHTWSHLP